MSALRASLTLLSLLAALASGHAQAEIAMPVAGFQPDRRPVAAPRISVFEPTDTWRQQAMLGIAEPRHGLGFFANQGAWYTPFNRPNLKGRYDIRGLHAASTVESKKENKGESKHE